MAGPGFTLFAQHVVETLGGGPQPDLLEARQMQALSLAVHIPIVCFGIAFPAMILFVEGLYLRTGDPTYKALAKRWSKVALILFAVGVVTGTILSFEFGLLWPDFMATFGEVFGVAFGLEGISFFVEAIFIAIYVYGWDRLSDRAHFLTGIPIVLSGFAGSFNVIAVNGWMNDPQGFDVVDGKVVDPRPWEALFNANMWHELIHMYLAGYIVAGFIVAGVYAYAWLQGPARPLPPHRPRRDARVRVARRAGAGRRRRLGGPPGGRDPAGQARRRSRGCAQTQAGAPFTIGGFYDDEHRRRRATGSRCPKLLSLLAYHDPNATVTGLDSAPPQDRPPVNVVRFAFQTMVGIGTGAGPARRAVPPDLVAPAPPAALAMVLPGGHGRRAAVAGRADLRAGSRPRSAASRGSSTRSCARSRRSPPRTASRSATSRCCRLPRARRRGRLAAPPACAPAAVDEVAATPARKRAG